MSKFKNFVFILIMCMIFTNLPINYNSAKADDAYPCSFPVIYGQTDARAMLSLINNLRATASDSNSTKALQYDYDLEKVAMQRAAELAILMSNKRPDGNDYTQTLADYGFDIGRRGPIYGENIAYGTLDSMDMQATFKFWCEDPGSRNNFLSGFSYIGIGHVKIEKLDYWAVICSTQARNLDVTSANDSESIATVMVSSSMVRSVNVSYESGANSVQAGETVTLPRYIPKVEFTERDPDEELILAPLEFISNDGYVSAANGTMIGLKEGNGTITASLFGKNYSYGITVTHGNGVVTNVPTQVITQSPTQPVTQAPTPEPTHELVVIEIPTKKPTQTPTQEVTPEPTQIITQTPTQSVTQIPTQVITESPTQTPTPTPLVTQTPTQSPVNSSDIITYDNLKYQILSSNKVKVLGYASKSTATKLNIPDNITVDGKKYTVVEIASEAFSKNKKLKTIVIGKNITTIGSKAFEKCTSLTKVQLPKNLKTIGKQAFYGSKKLKSIVFKGTKVTKIGKKAFGSIYSKAIITVPKSMKSKYTKLINSSGISSKVTIKNS